MAYDQYDREKEYIKSILWPGTFRSLFVRIFLEISPGKKMILVGK